MRKSKVLKALLVFGMSVATATSVAVTAGCGHTHTYDENEWGKDGSKHWRVATCEEHPGEKFDEADHVDENNDKECDVCGGAISSGTTPGGTTPGGDDDHTHTWSTTYDADHADANGHWHWCTAGDDCDETDAKDGQAAHVDDNSDNVCDTCGYSGGELPAGYTDLANKTVIYQNPFMVNSTLTKFNSWGTVGLYTSNNATDGDDTHKVEISGGKATLVKPTDSKSTTYAYLDFGDVEGLVEGYFDITVLGKIGGYTPVQFNGVKADGTVGEVFGLRLNSDKWQYRKNEGDATAAETDVAAVVNTSVGFHFSYNTYTNILTLKVDNDKKPFVTNLALDATGLKGIKFSTQGNGGTSSSYIAIDNVIVVKSEVDISDYKAAVANKITSIGTDLEGAADSVKTAYNSAKTEYETAVESATTVAAVDDVYGVFEGKVVSALKEAFAAVQATQFPATNYTTEDDAENGIVGNKAPYEAVINAVTNATTYSEVKTAINVATNKLSGEDPEIKNDAWYNATKYTLTFVGADIESETLLSTANTVKPEDPTAADSKFVGWYTDETYTTEFTFGSPLSENTSVYAKWHGIYESGLTDVLNLQGLKHDALPTSSAITFTDDGAKFGTQNSKQTEVIDGKTYEYATGLKTGGKTTSKLNIKITLTAESKIHVAFKPGGSGERNAWIGTAVSDVTDVATYGGCVANDSSKLWSFDATLQAGEYYLNFNNNIQIYAIHITQGTLVTSELTDINGTVTVADGVADLSNVTFSVEGGTTISATELGNKVTAVINDDNTVTVSYGKLSKRFSVA